MRRHRPSPAMGVAILAVLLSMSGVAYAVDEWTGANIVDGSLTTADYANNDIQSVDIRDDTVSGGGLRSTDIAPDAVKGTDVKESTLNGVGRKLLYNVSGNGSPSFDPLVTLGGFKLEATCYSSSGETALTVWANGPGGTVNFTRTTSTDNGPTSTEQGGRALSANTDESLFNTGALSTLSFNRNAGTLFLSSGSVLVKVDYMGWADNRTSPGTCHLLGTATMAG
jgi:hypothetical protein